MKRTVSFLVTLFLLVPALHAAAQAIQDDRTRARPEDRRAQQLRAATQSPAPPVVAADASDSALLAALNGGGGVVTTLARTGSGSAFGAVTSLGVIKPIVGTSFVVMSTGVAGTSAPQPGTDYGSTGTDGDSATLTLTLNAPAGATRLSFSYRFMSAEFPEYVGSQYNDTFTAVVSNASSTAEIARSSINSAPFVPASASNAFGSGYAIKNAYGNPDAGLTNWIPVSAQITGGTTVTLKFSIADVGDGIYDSQVLISALSFNALEILDLNPDFLSNGTVKTDVNQLATGGRRRKGVTADGVSTLLLRTVPSTGTTVRYTLLDASSDDGGLQAIGSSAKVSDLVVPVVYTTSGPRAYALYVAPENFEKTGFESVAERTIRLRVTYGSTDGTTTTAESDLVIARPPVVFVHGLWGGGGEDWSGNPLGSWEDQPLLVNGSALTRYHLVADYTSTNYYPFSRNVVKYRDWINNALDRARSDDLAATRVDVVGHSMGGVLARAYAARSDYRRSDNYQQGDFNRAITLNSPHSGSPLADILVTLRENFFVGATTDYLMSKLDMRISTPSTAGFSGSGAVDDLRVHSPALNAIAEVDVKGHAVAGTGGSDAVAAAGVVGTLANLATYVPQPPFTAALFKTVAFLADAVGLVNSAVYGNEEHDIIVPLGSQLGGLPVAATTTLHGLQSIHTSITASSDVTAVDRWLRTPPSSQSFVKFPAAGGFAAADELQPQQAPLVAGDLPPVGLTLSVAGSSSVVGGATVTLTAVPQAGASVTQVLFVGPNVSQTDTAAPFEAQFTIPVDYLGPFDVTAVGRNASGVTAMSNALTLQVSTTASLTAVHLQPATVLLTTLNGTYPLTAIGAYSDGVPRKLAGQSATSFTSSNPGVVTVDLTGTLTAVGTGYATVRVANGALDDSISVVVNPHASDPPPMAEAGADQGVMVGATVTLTGTASGVPAGVTASYDWRQVSGPAVALNGATSSSPTFVASPAGTYVFSLIVRAGLAESAPDTVTVVAGAATAPAITLQPIDRTVANTAPQATFSAAASGIPTPTIRWQETTDGSTWTDLSNTSPYSGVTTNMLALTVLSPSLSGRQYRAVFTNGSGTATSNAARLTVTLPQLHVSPATLRFAGRRAGATSALTAVTTPQTVTVSVTGGSTAWSVQADKPWLRITNDGKSSGAGQFTVAVVDPANSLAGLTNTTATITVTPTVPLMTAVTVQVLLTIDQTDTSSAPFGQIDTPVQNASGLVGAIGVTGWALDDVAVSGVKIYRNCYTWENQANCQVIAGNRVVYIGDAAFLAGARPDVEAAFPTHPQSYRAGWGYLMLTNMLPHSGTHQAFGGQGSLTLYAFAADPEGNRTLLGRSSADHTPTEVVLDNDHIAKPFGAIDTPGQGQAVSGTLANFGWALTPDGDTVANANDIHIPSDGSTMRVFIDGVAVGNVSYNQCRGSVGNPVPGGAYCDDDVANIFGNTSPQPTLQARTANPTPFRNLDGGRAAIGAFVIDTTALANGLHTIAWGVTDSAARPEGIGSRFFTVLNSSADAPMAAADRAAEGGLTALLEAPALVRGDASSLAGLPVASVAVGASTGYGEPGDGDEVLPSADGRRRVRMPELGRLALSLGPVDGGYLAANGTLRDLPPGSRLDTGTGAFTWMPGPGYVGTYELVFVRGGEQIPVSVTIGASAAAMAGGSEIRMCLDLPRTGQELSGAFRVAGWALDPQAAVGAGIGFVHVWAQRRDAAGASPVFLGSAALGGRRPDVGGVFGPQYDNAGFNLAAEGLAPGRYDVTAYAWNRRTGRWEDARTASVIVR